ncbi:hypothetical protein L1987_00973 [Smallanthus sonchifolius]|uniref:Uncharacterized protein n=1 Tax=Smallanthus sonchifolius TaxID=185202 RepID=A0ACB9K3U6_9ASTR|nr:hypothetical protein L1987_00973 [Smallanthus sonchifolius]
MNRWTCSPARHLKEIRQSCVENELSWVWWPPLKTCSYKVRVDHISIAFINRDEITRLKAQHPNMSHQQVFGTAAKNVI